MARPPKDPSLRMDSDLRIPMTADQKRMVYDAATADESDVAAWVRPVLLKAAKDRLEQMAKASRKNQISSNRLRK